MLMMILKKAGNWLKLHKNLSYLIIYTVLFFLIFTGVYINFYARGLSFIQLPDGFHQYYPKMVYIDGFFKELFSNFLRGDFTVPQFDLNIGIGEFQLFMLLMKLFHISIIYCLICLIVLMIYIGKMAFLFIKILRKHYLLVKLFFLY